MPTICTCLALVSPDGGQPPGAQSPSSNASRRLITRSWRPATGTPTGARRRRRVKAGCETLLAELNIDDGLTGTPAIRVPLSRTDTPSLLYQETPTANGKAVRAHRPRVEPTGFEPRWAEDRYEPGIETAWLVRPRSRRSRRSCVAASRPRGRPRHAAVWC